MKSTIAKVTLQEYDHKWVELFNNAKKEIIEAIGENDVFFEHIGSTSIPGAVAKPEIDIMVGVDNIKNAEKFIKPLEEIGYLYFKRFEEFEPERRYFRKSDGIIPLVHIHMVEKGSEFWNDRILFRDYLRRSPELVWRYNKLKKELVEKFKGDRNDYSEEKDKFVIRILNALKN